MNDPMSIVADKTRVRNVKFLIKFKENIKFSTKKSHAEIYIALLM